MAGKHNSTYATDFNPPGSGIARTFRPVFPGSRLDRAYAEGRTSGKTGIGTNPHVTGTAEYLCWGVGTGNAANTTEAAKIQTAQL